MLSPTTGLAVLSRIAIGPSSLTSNTLPVWPAIPLTRFATSGFFVQHVRAFPARSYLLAVSFAEVIDCSRGAAYVGESNKGGIVPELGGGVEGGF